ncbi:MAG TPA: hypothetical protein DD379_20155 [Cyanobacteria bacterium UBA11162]|nr:hypothetical protein [Cyanobacteria bacterium UBA12227]HAX88701.1 hypothetical protein [Cyanobacteria bacterium UBA11370]HBL13665.1 hypothetical protein [Cyanobacteria bacterium UBA11162]HBY81267.1 hypothetical protein [Cyanobacteria bacterium UBA11148]
MTTHFITAEIDLQESPKQLHQAIETELEKRGEPLRWAVTAVDTEQQKVQIEAIVTTPSPTPNAELQTNS